MKYATHVQQTPQSEPLLSKTMIPNAAGGYVFEIDDWQRLKRFLILGCEGGSFYESEKKLTVENAEVVLRCLRIDGARTVDEIVRVSNEGLAPKNDAAIFALALVTKHGDDATRKLAFTALPKVCRIGTHLFQFVDAREAIGGGWGRGARTAIARWYTEKSVPVLVNQVLKYAQRNRWSQRDLLRLSHPVGDASQNPVFEAVCRPEKWNEVDDPLARGYVRVREAVTSAEVARLITDHRLPRELVPTQFLTDAVVWEALLPHLATTALVRNLGNLSKCGLLTPLSDAAKLVQRQLTDPKTIRGSRLHPLAVLLAARTYGSGHGLKGKGTWTVVPQVIEALDETFDLAFGNVTPTGKNFVLGVDISGSMSIEAYGGGASLPGGMLPCEAAAAMALITARIEPNYFIGGFTTSFKDLGVTAKDTIATVMRKTKNLPHGGTDTSVAIRHAAENGIPAEVFVIYTDNETWAGEEHTCASLESYRRKTGLPAKLAVVAFTATNRTVRDTRDVNSLDFVGLDASLPQALSAFAEL